MPPTKVGQIIDVFLEIAQNAIRKGVEKNVSADYEQLLLIDHVLTSETAHEGTEILVEISEETSGDEFWTELRTFIAGNGQAASETITNSPLAVGEGDSPDPITVASTTGFEVEGTYFFLKDATFGNSEIVYEVSFVSNTSITLRDGVTRAHANTSVLYSIAQTYAVRIPSAASRVRVTYNNTKDAGGSTVGTRSRIAEITGF